MKIDDLGLTPNLGNLQRIIPGPTSNPFTNEKGRWSLIASVVENPRPYTSYTRLENPTTTPSGHGVRHWVYVITIGFMCLMEIKTCLQPLDKYKSHVFRRPGVWNPQLGTILQFRTYLFLRDAFKPPKSNPCLLRCRASLILEDAAEKKYHQIVSPGSPPLHLATILCHRTFLGDSRTESAIRYYAVVSITCITFSSLH